MVAIALSSFEYLRQNANRMDEPFATWAAQASDDFVSAYWTADGNKITPIAVLLDKKNKPSEFSLLGVSENGRNVEPETFAYVQNETKKRLLHRNEEILQLKFGRKESWRDVKGEVFRPKGSNNMFPGIKDYGIYLLTDSCIPNSNQAQWQVQDDKSIKITDQAGNRKIGSLKSDETIMGFNIDAPIKLQDDASDGGVKADRCQFLAYALMSTLVMPIDRSPATTKLLFWTKELGGEAFKLISGLTT